MVNFVPYNARMLNGGRKGDNLTYGDFKSFANVRDQSSCMVLFLMQRPQQKVKMYSIDMMIAYANTNKPQMQELILEAELLKEILKVPVWDYSPFDVLMNMKNPNFKFDATKILYTDLKFPVFFSIFNNLEVIDGYHRLARLYYEEVMLKNKDKVLIRYINFQPELLNKFIITEAESFKKIRETKVTINQLIEQFFKYFCLNPSR